MVFKLQHNAVLQNVLPTVLSPHAQLLLLSLSLCFSRTHTHACTHACTHTHTHNNNICTHQVHAQASTVHKMVTWEGKKQISGQSPLVQRLSYKEKGEKGLQLCTHMILQFFSFTVLEFQPPPKQFPTQPFI